MKKGITLIIISLFVSQLIVSEAIGLSVRQGQQPMTPVDALARYDEIVARDKALRSVDLVTEIAYKMDASFSGYSKRQIKALMNEYMKVFFEHSVRGIVKSFVINYLAFHKQGFEVVISPKRLAFRIVTIDESGRVRIELGRGIIRLNKGEVEVDAIALFDAMAEYCVAMIIATRDYKALSTKKETNENVYYWIESLKMVMNLDFYPLWLSGKQGTTAEWQESEKPLSQLFPGKGASDIVNDFIIESSVTKAEEIKQSRMLEDILDKKNSKDQILYDYGYLLYNKQINEQRRDRIFLRVLASLDKPRPSLAKLRDLYYCVFDCDVLPPVTFSNVTHLQDLVNAVLSAQNEAEFYEGYSVLLKEALNLNDRMIAEEIMRLLDDEGRFSNRPRGGETVNMIARFKKDFFKEISGMPLEDVVTIMTAKKGSVAREDAIALKKEFDRQAQAARTLTRRAALRMIIRELLVRRFGRKVFTILEEYFNDYRVTSITDIYYSIEPFPVQLPFGADADNPGGLVYDPDEYVEEFEYSKLTYAQRMVGEHWRGPETDWYVKHLFYLGTLYARNLPVRSIPVSELTMRLTDMLKPLIRIYEEQNVILNREDERVCLASA
jgi:hypothetical protein